MGFLGDMVDTVRDFFGSKSENTNNNNNTNYDTSVQTVYEPDRVRIEELQKENNQMMIEAQKDIIQMNGQMQGLIIEAQVKGFEYASKILTTLTNDINIIAEQRIKLLENGHLDIVARIETMYSKFEKEISKDNDKFNIKTLPKLLGILNKFEEGSTSYKLYEKSITKQIDLNIDFFSEKIKALLKRQQTLIDSSVKTKEHILENSAKIVEDRMKFLEKNLETQQKSLDFKSNSQNLLENKH